MAESPADHSAEHWKKRYYDQLDRLEQKEAEWIELEAVLKRAIGRLSLAAEGLNRSLDSHIRDIRAVIRDKVNRQRLDGILDELSNLLARMDEKRSAPDKQTVTHLQHLLDALKLSGRWQKPAKKLSRRIAKATDTDAEELVNDIADLFRQMLVATPAAVQKKTGLLERLLGPSEMVDTQQHTQLDKRLLSHLVEILPWPDELSAEARVLVKQISSATGTQALSHRINQLEKIISRWQASSGGSTSRAVEPPVAASEHLASSGNPGSELLVYRQCLTSMLDRLDDPESPNGRLAALRTLANEASQQQQLDHLAAELAGLLVLSQQLPVNGSVDVPAAIENQPSIQEMLIRLLEQLAVPVELNADVEQMKARLEAETDPTDWKRLLKDVAQLINSVRSRMQREKHEFEDFLQQITERLQEMDDFLQIESDTLLEARAQGRAFDETVQSHVQDIRHDVHQANDLDMLKGSVEKRLDIISRHIRDYRNVEDGRIKDAQKNLVDMQTRMVSLEQEKQSLKKVIVEKNKQAMFDTLTGIPNRLSYEKKILEEIARWKRFGNPLSIAIWDVDYFKKVNDSFGHKAGDKVLKTIAHLLNERIRETDFLARYGGEEFIMLLPGTREEETLRLVNELREKVAACGFHYHGDPVHITISCGVSCFRDNDTLEKVFERADQAPYKAKRAGRNHCVVASCLSDQEGSR